MKVVRPKFTLKRPCPNCEQGSSLVLYACRACGNLIVACDEEGSIFPNPMDLSRHAQQSSDSWSLTGTQCPRCNNIGGFELATGDDIQAFGIQVSEYE